MDTKTVVKLILVAVSLPPLVKSVEDQPIKLSVQENFNNVPRHLPHGLPFLAPNFVHQGSNFFFNPHVQLPISLLPPHVHALVSSVHQNNGAISVIEDKQEVIPSSIEVVVNENFGTAALPLPYHSPETIIEEMIVAQPVDNAVPYNIEITEAPVSINESIEISSFPKPVEFIINNNFDISELTSLPIHNEPLPIIEEEELVKIPVPPVLPPIPLDIVPAMIEDEIKMEEQANVEILPSIPAEIPFPEPIEVIVNEELSLPPLPIHNEAYPVIEEFVEVPPPPPILAPISLSIVPAVIEEEIKIEEPDSVEILSSMPAELSLSEPVQVIVEEELSVPPVPLPLPWPIHNEPSRVIEELVEIPAPPPVLPSISLDIAPVLVEEEIKVEEPLPSLSAVLPFPEPVEIIVEEELSVPPLPSPLPWPIQNEPYPIIEELVKMPEAPVLPPLSLQFLPPVIKEDIIVEETAGVIRPSTIEITEKPIVIESVEVLPPKQPELIMPKPIEVIVNENIIISPPPAPVPANSEALLIKESIGKPALRPGFLQSVTKEEFGIKEQIEIEKPVKIARPYVVAEPTIKEKAMELFSSIPVMNVQPFLHPIRLPKVKKPLEEILQRPYSKDVVLLEKKIVPTNVRKQDEEFTAFDWRAIKAQPVDVVDSLPVIIERKPFEISDKLQKGPLLLRRNMKPNNLPPFPIPRFVLKPKLNQNIENVITERITPNAVIGKRLHNLRKIMPLPTLPKTPVK